MNKNRNSEVICCPNKEWRLFKRDGVYYACGRKHGSGKHSLGTRDRKKAIEQLLLLDAAIGEELAENAPVSTPIPVLKKQQSGRACKEDCVTGYFL